MKNKNEFNLLFYKNLNTLLSNNFSYDALLALENFFFKKKLKSIRDINQPLLYVGGYARSRSTFLVNELYKTKIFNSLTYAQMPFVNAPIFSSKISKFLYSKKKIERSHNDGINIDLNSPESFEEIIWFKNFLKEFHKTNSINLRLLDYPLDLITELRMLQKKLHYIYGEKNYLCKSNYFYLRYNFYKLNNINFYYLVTIRDPIQQSISLTNQHINFSKYGKNNYTIGKYLNLVGKYEFGQSRKPVLLNNERLNKISLKYLINNDNINYYLSQWLIIYSFISSLKNDQNVKVIDLEISKSIDVLRSLNYINPSSLDLLLLSIESNKKIYNKSDYNSVNIDKNLLDEASETYSNLIRP